MASMNYVQRLRPECYYIQPVPAIQPIPISASPSRQDAALFLGIAASLVTIVSVFFSCDR